MTQEQAIKLLISAVEVAQQKGAFSLIDAEKVINAIRVLKPSETKPEE